MIPLPSFSEVKAFSVVGTGKESGKTTTCNFLIREALKGKKIGITSFGMGGNQVSLFIPEGSYIALAKNCLLSKKLELVEETEAQTPWGPIVIGKARENSQGSVAGPLLLFDLIQVKKRFLELGCETVIIDGSLNRLSSSSFKVCESFALSLCCGNFVPDSLLEEATSLLEKFFTPRSDSFPPFFDKPFLFTKGGWMPMKGLRIPSELPSRVEAIFIPGALTMEKIETLGIVRGGISFLVEEPWMIFLSSQEWGELKKKGVKFQCCFPSKISFLSINPTPFSENSPQKKSLLLKLKDLFPSLFVLDLKVDG